MQNEPRRVLVVDDHPLVREGLRALIRTDKELVVCGETGSVRRALELTGETRPDIAIIDLALEDGSGLDLIQRLSRQDTKLRLLVCSMSDESLFARRAILAGAHGYISKLELSQQIVEAIHRVLTGHTYLSSTMVDEVLAEYVERPLGRRQPIGDLSNRELEVFSLIGKGLGSAQIAATLGLSVKTVETHREKVKHKLGLTSSSELVRRAIQWDLQQH